MTTNASIKKDTQELNVGSGLVSDSCSGSDAFSDAESRISLWMPVSESLITE